jgi:hypothetical protein
LETLSLDIQPQHGYEVLSLSFPYKEVLIKELKKLPQVKWSASKQVWMMPFAPQIIETTKSKLGHLAQMVKTQLYHAFIREWGQFEIYTGIVGAQQFTHYGNLHTCKPKVCKTSKVRLMICDKKPHQANCLRNICVFL